MKNVIIKIENAHPSSKKEGLYFVARNEAGVWITYGTVSDFEKWTGTSVEESAWTRVTEFLFSGDEVVSVSRVDHTDGSAAFPVRAQICD